VESPKSLEIADIGKTKPTTEARRHGEQPKDRTQERVPGRSACATGPLTSEHGTLEQGYRLLQGCKNRKQDRSAEGSVRPGDACFCLVHVSFTFFQLQA
jgi:hypothetical protein